MNTPFYNPNVFGGMGGLGFAEGMPISKKPVNSNVPKTALEKLVEYVADSNPMGFAEYLQKNQALSNSSDPTLATLEIIRAKENQKLNSGLNEFLELHPDKDLIESNTCKCWKCQLKATHKIHYCIAGVLFFIIIVLAVLLYQASGGEEE